MEISSSHQLYVFFLSVLSGIALGIFYDLERSLRRLRFAGDIRTTIEDIIFVGVSVGAVITLGLLSNNGQMRYYQVMGSISGALFYAAFLSRIVMNALRFIYKATEKIIVRPFLKLFALFCVPVKKLGCGFRVIAAKIRKTEKSIHRSMKKRKKHLKKRIKML